MLQTPDSEVPELTYPLIVKPKNEAVSFGLRVVESETELRDAAKVIYDEFGQAVLAEQFIAGREVNVGLLGNDPPEAFPPVALNFGEGGPQIYTYEDKTSRSGRRITHTCPAPIGNALCEEAQDLARRAFTTLGCYDCARVDMRLDDADQFYILEINSLPSLGEHGSYLVGAERVGLDFTAFINRLVEVASARYFGTPSPPSVTGVTQNPVERVFRHVTERRERVERRLREWVNLPSRTTDPIGVAEALKKASTIFRELGMTPIEELTDDDESVMTWQTARGLDDGLLFIVNLDVPVDVEFPAQQFRRDPEWLYGEGGPRWELVTRADLPPFPERPGPLREDLAAVAARWDIPLATESSAWPSVAGFVPSDTPCLCGVGPVARDLRTPQECVQRISLIQRTLLLAEFLASRVVT